MSAKRNEALMQLAQKHLSKLDEINHRREMIKSLNEKMCENMDSIIAQLGPDVAQIFRKTYHPSASSLAMLFNDIIVYKLIPNSGGNIQPLCMLAPTKSGRFALWANDSHKQLSPLGSSEYSDLDEATVKFFGLCCDELGKDELYMDDYRNLITKIAEVFQSKAIDVEETEYLSPVVA